MQAPEPSQRLVSLDAFRGFTMFWLLGGKAFVMAIAGLGLGVVSDFLQLSTDPHTVGGLAVLRPDLAEFHVDGRRVGSVFVRAGTQHGARLEAGHRVVPARLAARVDLHWARRA